MDKLKLVIKWKERWNGLISRIYLVEENKLINPNDSLDWAKSILESIAKTILNDKSIKYKDDESIWKLIKQVFEQLPIFIRLTNIDQNNAKVILNSIAAIATNIWLFRNSHWFYAHWQDLESKKFDYYLVDLCINSSDLLSSFLITCHGEDLKDRSRMYYEECELFNSWLDNLEVRPEIRWIPCKPSFTLFQNDIEAYKESRNEFNNDIDAQIWLIDLLDDIEEPIVNILQYKNILQPDQLEIFMQWVNEHLRISESTLSMITNSGILKQVEVISQPMRDMVEKFNEIHKTMLEPFTAVTEITQKQNNIIKWALDTIKPLLKIFNK